MVNYHIVVGLHFIIIIGGAMNTVFIFNVFHINTKKEFNFYNRDKSLIHTFSFINVRILADVWFWLIRVVRLVEGFWLIGLVRLVEGFWLIGLVRSFGTRVRILDLNISLKEGVIGDKRSGSPKRAHN
jgi:hypothetical protein